MPGRNKGIRLRAHSALSGSSSSSFPAPNTFVYVRRPSSNVFKYNKHACSTRVGTRPGRVSRLVPTSSFLSFPDLERRERADIQSSRVQLAAWGLAQGFFTVYMYTASHLLGLTPLAIGDHEAVGRDDTFHLRGLFSAHHGTIPDESTGQVLARPVR